MPPGEVTVAVEYSSLNYKDGLAVTGAGKIIRQFPMVPGIDLAGVVAESSHPDWQAGDRVVLTGWGIGEKHWGGYTQRNRVKPEWLVRLPAQITTKQAMAHRYGWVYGDAVRDGAGVARLAAGRWRGRGHRGGRRRGQHRRRNPRRAWVHRGRFHRPSLRRTNICKSLGRPR